MQLGVVELPADCRSSRSKCPTTHLQSRDQTHSNCQTNCSPAQRPVKRCAPDTHDKQPKEKLRRQSCQCDPSLPDTNQKMHLEHELQYSRVHLSRCPQHDQSDLESTAPHAREQTRPFLPHIRHTIATALRPQKTESCRHCLSFCQKREARSVRS